MSKELKQTIATLPEQFSLPELAHASGYSRHSINAYFAFRFGINNKPDEWHTIGLKEVFIKDGPAKNKRKYLIKLPQ